MLDVEDTELVETDRIDWENFNRDRNGVKVDSITACPHCSSNDRVLRRRMMTQYYDDESNFLISCYACFQDSNEYWQDMWDTYYRNCF